MWYNRVVSAKISDFREGKEMRKITGKITAAILMITFLFCFAGCSGQRSSEATTTTTKAYDYYLLLDTEISEFNSVYTLYMRTHPEEMKIDKGTGKTYNGEECTFTYSTTEKYKNLTLTKSYSDRMVVDEYFRLDDGSLFMARTTAYSDGTFGLVEKYIVRDNKVLFLNEETKTVDTIADLSTEEESKVMGDKDMFLHFEDIEYVYEQK